MPCRKAGAQNIRAGHTAMSLRDGQNLKQQCRNGRMPAGVVRLTSDDAGWLSSKTLFVIDEIKTMCRVR